MRCLPSLFLVFSGLLSSSLAAPAESPAAGAFYVNTLPGLDQDLNHPLTIFAGHISSDPHLDQAKDTDVTSHLYFVLVKNRRTADKPRVMFWFNGGPGCSSFDGLMMENGPWRLDANGQPHLKEGGWEEYTTMIYVDQPAGTGYSYTSTDHYVHTLEEATEQFVVFLKNFYKVFPEYEYMDTYLGGESYAGQYIPYIATSLLSNRDLKTPLRGLAIGNGWMDARRQYPSYLAYSVKHGLVVDQSDDWKEKKRLTDECMEDYNKVTGTEPIKTDLCEGLLGYFLETDKKNEQDKKLCTNMYDVRLTDIYPACGMNWPPEIHNVTSYLDRQDVVNALHATAHPGAWTECKGAVHTQFRENLSNSSIVLLPQIMEKIPVLIFAGDQDLICNYVGLEAMIQAMKWNGETGLGTVQTQQWSVDGKSAGTWVESRNLTYVKVFNASHMASYDVPHVAHDMVLRFMGVNFTAILENEGTAQIPSTLGSEAKPIPSATVEPSVATPSESASVLNQVYNSGSTFAVVIAIVGGLGAFLCWRLRRRRVQLPTKGDEAIPLTTNGSRYPGKGKGRATESTEQIFNVGDASEDEDGYHSGSASPRPRRMS